MTKKLTTLFALVVASVTAIATAHAAEAQGDAQAGAKKTAMCTGCHGIPGYQATVPEVHKVPMIAGQNAKYLAAALDAYRKGDRRHPTMRGIAASLSDQDIADLAAYYEQLGKSQTGKAELPAKPRTEPKPQVAALLQKAACVSCHGDNFSKPIDPAYPKIAGQHADYLFVALKSYKAEPNAVLGRSNPVMGGIAKQFSNAELKALANYVGSLDGELRTVPEPRFR